jgi:hypothetical protein
MGKSPNLRGTHDRDCYFQEQSNNINLSFTNGITVLPA